MLLYREYGKYKCHITEQYDPQKASWRSDNCLNTQKYVYAATKPLLHNNKAVNII